MIRETAVRPVLSPLELGQEGPRVVAIGGGHGLAQVLEAAQQYAGEIAAVVTVADDGGSSGRLTRALEIPPPGDMRRCLLALSPEPTLWKELFGYRFEEGDVAGHSLGNLVLAALTEIVGDFEQALQVAANSLRAVGRVIPAARTSLHLQAVVDGTLVDGQEAITRTRGRISELRLTPAEEAANPVALEVVFAADQVVIGPGSLYTSVLSALMVPGLAKAVNESPASVVYVCNLITQDGETLGMDARAHLEALTGLSGVHPPTTVLAHSGAVEVPAPLEPVRVDRQALAELCGELVTADLADPAARWPQHDPIRLGAALARLAEEA